MSLETLADLQTTCEEVKKIKSGDQPKGEFRTVEIDGHKVLCEVSSKFKTPTLRT